MEASNKIASLAIARKKNVDPKLIEFAQTLLTEVERGNITSLCGVGESLDGSMLVFRAGDYNIQSTMGAIETLKMDIYWEDCSNDR